MAKLLRKILVSRFGSMKDVIFATAVIRNLKAGFPESEIVFLTYEMYVPLLQNNPMIKQVIGLNPIERVFKRAQQLREHDFDTLVDLNHSLRSAFLARLTGIPTRIGFRFPLARSFYSASVPIDKNVSTLENFLRSLQPLMPEPEFMLPEIRFEDKEGEWIDFYLKSGGLEFNKPIIGIYPGSSQPNRIWLHERVIQLSEKLLESDFQVLYIKGPNQGSMLQKIMDRVPNSILCTDVLPLRKLAVLLSRLDVFVGNAGTVMNLAIAVGTKTVGILGPDRPDMEFPYPESSDYTAVYREIDCRPCYEETCPLGTMECMYKVEVETVYKAIREALH